MIGRQNKREVLDNLADRLVKNQILADQKAKEEREKAEKARIQ